MGRDADRPQHWHPPWRAWPERREAPVCGDPSRKATLPRNSCTQPPTDTLHPTLHTSAPQTKKSFSSITIASRKVTRTASLPETGAPPGLERPRSASPAGSMSRGAGAVPVLLRRRAVVVKMTESRETICSSDTVQATRAQNGPRTAHGAAADPRHAHGTEPVVLRRKATIVKVTEERESYRISPVSGGGQSQARRSEVRYSYTEGLQPSRYSWDPQTRPLEAAERSVPKLHRSTISLHLSTPPFTNPAGDERADAGRSTGQRRPVSFHEGMLSHPQPAWESLSDLLPHRASCQRPGLPPKTSSKVSPSARSVHPEARSLRQAQELTEGKPLPGAVRESQPPPTLINSSGREVTLISRAAAGSHRTVSISLLHVPFAHHGTYSHSKHKDISMSCTHKHRVHTRTQILPPRVRTHKGIAHVYMEL